jgi:hypothetical protein
LITAALWRLSPTRAQCCARIGTELHKKGLALIFAPDTRTR